MGDRVDPGADHLDEVIEQLVTELEANAEPSRADAMAAYMRHKFEFLGLTAPVRRQLATSFQTAFRGASEAALLDTVDRLWALPKREYTYVATDLLRTHWRQLTPAAVPRIRTRIETNSWWDSVDPLAHVVGVLVLNHRELSAEMDDWARDRNRWIIRVALLHQLGWKDAAEPERLFGYCLALGSQEDFFIRKAIGWALRDLSGRFPDEVLDFVDDHRSELSPLSASEATKHLLK